MTITPDQLRAQEALFARAFETPDLSLVQPLYHPEVVYLSPTVRLYKWPRRIEGAEKTLEFIALTLASCEDIHYEAVEMAGLPDGRSCFARIHFDWTMRKQRLRSNYVVLYRYRDRVIGQQEIYYDPSGGVEVLSQGA